MNWMRRIYLDHNATTPLDVEVLAAMKPYLSGWVGNASSLHWAGAAAKHAIEKARIQVAGFINALPKELIFTSGATESVNHVLKGIFSPRNRKKNHLIISAVEHHATLDCAETLSSWGVDVDIVPVDFAGRIDPANIVSRVREDTGLISMLWANNETGTIYPADEIVKVGHEAGIPVHLDAAQAFGKLTIDVRRVPVDYLSCSAHKIYGPQGIGALFVRHDRKLRRLLDGGDQERSRRGGTENIAGIVGFGQACEITKRRFADDREHQIGLRDRLEQGLKDLFPDLIINGDPFRRLGNTLNVRFPGITNEALLIALDLEGIAVSSGSACASGAVDPSHVLMAMGCNADEAKSAIRFSIGRNNTLADIEFVLDILPRLVRQLQAA